MTTWGPDLNGPECHNKQFVGLRKINQTYMSVDRGMDKDDMVIYRMEYHSAIKRNEIMPFVAIWMDPESSRDCHTLVK